ncbi:hypothetical protein [Desulfosporosinus sp.]|uniref:hypothetical protein n=1 Tax=Desulfosporosinus sp. TaxID=157907 RepID=UPI0025B7E19C|nr:hypothetical protein [Desulfosporosinus sp.]MBC2728569.1 hypothetical protein [Desulfosporosinus sp.]
MPYFSTGLLENVSTKGIRQSLKLWVNISNSDNSTVAIQIEGFSQNESKRVKYVEEFFTLSAGGVILKNYFIPFDQFEFVFFISSPTVAISLEYKDSSGNLISAPLKAAEVNV